MRIDKKWLALLFLGNLAIALCPGCSKSRQANAAIDEFETLIEEATEGLPPGITSSNIWQLISNRTARIAANRVALHSAEVHGLTDKQRGRLDRLKTRIMMHQIDLIMNRPAISDTVLVAIVRKSISNENPDAKFFMAGELFMCGEYQEARVTYQWLADNYPPSRMPSMIMISNIDQGVTQPKPIVRIPP